LAKNRVRIESNFPAVKRAAWETVQTARELALSAGKETAIRKVQSLNDSRGYNLPEDEIDKENIGFQSGRVYIGGGGEFYWRFFEYGTRYIPAYPMIRPASRVMRKIFLAEMGTNLEKFIKRRARV
jgi:HK97 gp10 family phage protein